MMSDMESMRTATSVLRRVATTGLVVGALSLTAAACGSDSSGEAADTTAAAADTTAAPDTTAASAVEITVDGAWARNSPMGAANGAAYFTVTASADDTMTGVSVDPSIAAMAEMHETVMSMGSETTMAMGSETTMGMGGGMTMQPVDSIPLTAGEPFVFEPGGYHIMLMELVKPLEIGQTITLTLSFEQAGDVEVEVPVLEEAP